MDMAKYTSVVGVVQEKFLFFNFQLKIAPVCSSTKEPVGGVLCSLSLIK